LFDSKCYLTCPEKTYISSETFSTKRVTSKGWSLRERAVNFDDFDIMGQTETVKSRAASFHNICGLCHTACLKCEGPLEEDCLIRINNSNTIYQSLAKDLQGNAFLMIALIGIVLSISCILIYLICRKYRIDESSSERDKKSTRKTYSYNQLVDNNERLLLNRLDNIPKEEETSDESEG
jgi:hypothetical protein